MLDEDGCEICECIQIYGCTDSEACNYDSTATSDDSSCAYAQENFDCDGNCLIDVDCNGDCGGDAESLDDCPVCYNSSINTGILGHWDGVNHSMEGADCSYEASFAYLQYPTEYRLEFNQLEDGLYLYGHFYLQESFLEDIGHITN